MEAMMAHWPVSMQFYSQHWQGIAAQLLQQAICAIYKEFLIRKQLRASTPVCLAHAWNFESKKKPGEERALRHR